MKELCQSKVIEEDEESEEQFIDERVDAKDGEINNNEFIDEEAATKSLAFYCKPIELYNTLQNRFKHQPIFLQRCLNYKIHALQQKRLKVALQVQGLVNMPPFLQWNSCKDYINFDPNNAPLHSFLPIFVMVTKQPSSPQGIFTLSKVYKVARVPLRDVGALSSQVTFLLPPLAKLLVHAKNKHLILFFAFVDPKNVFDISKEQIQDLDNCSGNVLWSMLSITTLCTRWLWNANCNTTPSRVYSPCFHAICTLDFWPGTLQHFDKALGLMIQVRPLPTHALSSLRRSEMRLQGHICAKEIELNIQNDPILNGTFKGYHSCQLSRNYKGYVEFHFLYYFNLCEKIEVTERYSCPFCLTKCYYFKSLQCHLNCTHDLFNFTYLLNADVPVVNVTCRMELLDPEGEILQESKPDLKTKLWIFGSHKPSRKTVASPGQEIGGKGDFTGPPEPVLQKPRRSSKRAEKEKVERKGGFVYTNAQEPSPGKRRKKGDNFQEEVQPQETKEARLEVASYLRSGLKRIRPKS